MTGLTKVSGETRAALAGGPASLRRGEAGRAGPPSGQRLLSSTAMLL